MSKLKRERPKPTTDGPPGWAMTIAYDLVAKLEGYGDLSLCRDVERIAHTIETQYRLAWKDGYAKGQVAVVEFMAAMVKKKLK